jgi:hypothetical protein
MAGNVDEWVVNERGSTTTTPYISGLKGGYWGPVRNRCRPMTTDHNQWHSGYQIGFRCCVDARSAEIPPDPDATDAQAIAAIPAKALPQPPAQAPNRARTPKARGEGPSDS